MRLRTGLDLQSRILAGGCRLIFRCTLRIRVEGLEHVPREGVLIVAPNHISNADPPIIGGWLAPALDRRPRFMAKDPLFKGIAGVVLRALGVIPVKAGGSDVEAYRIARSLLEAGEVLVIFPEGTRSRDGVLGTSKPGVALLASRHDIPVLPIGISGTDAFLQRGSRSPRFGARVIVRIGPPFRLSAERGGDRRAALKAADEEIMRRIAALLEPRHRGPWEPWADA